VADFARAIVPLIFQNEESFMHISMDQVRRRFAIGTLVIALHALTALAQVQPSLAPELRERIDKTAQVVLTQTGVPSASVAIVKDGTIVYLQAYGSARLDPRIPAQSEMRYSIGSISKQFTAAAMLLLQEEGKLSLDDRVSKYLPNLTRANEVSIRQLLSHTSGYQDYWPQDYVPPSMLQPITAEKIMDQWARNRLTSIPAASGSTATPTTSSPASSSRRSAVCPCCSFCRRACLLRWA
jgi:D-alanyl-D-alanine carboxypeptidase